MADSFERDPKNAISKILDEDLLYAGDWNRHDYPDHVNYVVYDRMSDQVVLIDGDYDVIHETGIRISDERLESETGAKRYKALSLDNADNLKLISQIQRELEDKILITPQAYRKSFDVLLCREIEFVQDEPTPSP